MTAARRRTRSTARRRHLLRDIRLAIVALIIAILACSGIYSLASAPPLPSAADQTHLVATVTAQQSITPENQVTTAAVQTQAFETTQLIAGLLPGMTPQPLDTAVPSPVPSPSPTSSIPYFYYTQAGDSLHALTLRFGVNPEDITSADPIPSEGLISPNQLLVINRKLYDTSSSTHIIPDSEIVFSPSAVDFDVAAYVKNAGGYLNSYSEFLGSTGMTTGIDVIKRVATEFSVNPRLLLALLEFKSHWVLGQPANLAETDYPMGYVELNHKGLYQQMSWIVSQLSQGYYGWRDGSVVEVTFPDKSTLRLAPDLNAGSVALQYLFADMYDLPRWAGALNPQDSNSFPALFERMFGNPWVRAQTIEPLFPATLTQPELELPFDPGIQWSFSGGPHAAFGAAGAWAALDFAPPSMTGGCYVSTEWVDASATGVVVRAANNQVVIDLDGDGFEQTGWTLLYMHIAPQGMVANGSRVDVGDHIGHPSCDGGVATGVNVHIARKYNGEWILADGAIPFEMNGWTAHAGEAQYQGSLTKGDQVVTAMPNGSPETFNYAPETKSE